MMMLIRHAEQMAFVVKVQRAVRLDQQETVYGAAIGLQRRASGYQGIGLLSLGVHPGDHVVLRQRLFCRFHGEAGREHFWQNNHIAPGNLFELAIKMAQVGRAIHPHQGLLQ